VFEDTADTNLAIGLDKVISSKGLEFVEAYFNWTRITDISSYCQYIGKTGISNINTIEYNNKNVEIVNMATEQLIVANGLKDVLIANTRDALYITQLNKEGSIKELSKRHYEDKNRYFDESPILYEKWGMVELLNRTAKCEVSRITVFPNRSFNATAEDGYSVNYFIAEGEARVYTESTDRKKCAKDSSVIFKSLSEYAISNEGKSDLVMIQTKSAEETKDGKKKKPKTHDSLVKLKPVFKQALWGGKKIKEVLKKSVGTMDIVSESWELSAHPAG
jgi:mannose-6-phosphate isomerase-like protein (cupin superfamily)